MQVSCYRKIRKAFYGEETNLGGVAPRALDGGGSWYDRKSRANRANGIGAKVGYRIPPPAVVRAGSSFGINSFGFINEDTHSELEEVSEFLSKGDELLPGTKKGIDSREPIIQCTRNPQGNNPEELRYSGKPRKRLHIKAYAAMRILGVADLPENLSSYPSYLNSFTSS